MAIGRISGPLLKSNLLRNGVDLAFETDLLYLDVTNRRIGVGTSSPQYALDVDGVARVTDLEITNNVFDIGNININGNTNTISTTAQEFTITTADKVVVANRVEIGDLEINNSFIENTNTNEDLYIRANGTGTVNIEGNTNITGNLHATGNISADGDIQIGDADTDDIILNAEVASDIIPDQTDTYSLGSAVKRWDEGHFGDTFVESITTNDISFEGLDLVSTPGNIFYVSDNGTDEPTRGAHPQDPVASIEYALGLASSGDTVYVYPGTYYEEFPITVPQGVTLKGHSLRSVTVLPTADSEYNDAFLVNGESTVEEITIKDFYSGGRYFNITETTDADTIKVNVGTSPFAHTYVSGGDVDFSDSTAPVAVTNATYDHTTGDLTLDLNANHDSHVGQRIFIRDLIFSCNGGNRIFPDNGYAFRFATDFRVNLRSPYIRNVSVITQGSTTSVSDPRGYDAGDAGKGAYVDGAYAVSASREASMLFHSVTFITPGVDALTITNGARVEWLNSFTYFANKGMYVFDSNDGLKGNGKTKLKVSGKSGSVSNGETITLYDTDGTTVIATGTIETADGDYFYLNGKVTGFEKPGKRSAKTVSAKGDAQLVANSKVGSTSVALDGTNDYLEIISEPDFGFGTGDFSVEAWINLDSITGIQNLFDFRAGADDDTALRAYFDATELNIAIGDTDVITPSTVFNASDWYHIAITRVSGTLRCYINGTLSNSYVSSEDLGTTKPLRVGAKYNGTEEFFAVKVDELRIRKGTGYSANFTAPTTPLVVDNDTVLLCHFEGDVGSIIMTDDNIFIQDIRFSGGDTATAFELVDLSDFGGEVRSIASAAVYGEYGIYADGPGVVMYLIGQNLAYIGNGKEVDNDPTTVVQANEVVKLNDANVYYSTVDHKGDFRVGDLFRVNQETGEVSFTNAEFLFNNNEGITFTDGTNTTIIDGTKVQAGNVKLSGNTIETVNGDLNLDASTGIINLQDDVDITGNLDVSGNVTIGGNIQIGDDAGDDLTITAQIASDIIPATDDTYNLGSASKNWAELHTGRLFVDTLEVNDNYIKSLESNGDINLTTNGTGNVVIDDLEFNGNTITNSTGNIVLNPSSEIVEINATGSLILPTGTTAQRPVTPETGMIRYNSQTSTFEAYDGTWSALGGVYDDDRDTYITPELTPGANDNVLRFYAGGDLVADVNQARFNVARLEVDDIAIHDNVLETITTNEDLLLQANGTGQVRIENFSFNGSVITNEVDGEVTILRQQGTGYFKVEGTGGFVIPVGTNANRHPSPEVGMMRYNSIEDRVEIYDVAENWVSVAGATGAVTYNDAEEIAIKLAITI